MKIMINNYQQKKKAKILKNIKELLNNKNSLNIISKDKNKMKNQLMKIKKKKIYQKMILI